MNPVTELKKYRFYKAEIEDLNQRIAKETSFRRRMLFREVKQGFINKLNRNKLSLVLGVDNE